MHGDYKDNLVTQSVSAPPNARSILFTPALSVSLLSESTDLPAFVGEENCNN